MSSNIFPNDTTYFKWFISKTGKICQENEKASCTSDIFAKNISGKGVIQNIQKTLKNQNKKTTSF